MADTSDPQFERQLAEQGEKVCVIIPAYKVEAHLQTVIRHIPSWVWRIVVVDDASPDQSAERALALPEPRLILVRHEVNQGVGGAIWRSHRSSASQ